MKAGIPRRHSTTTCPSPSPHPPRRPLEGSRRAPTKPGLSCDELEAYWAAHPDLPIEDRFPCPVVMGFTLKDDTFVENYGERWKFSFFGDHIQLGNFTLRWSWDGKQLTFSEIQGVKKATSRRGRPSRSSSSRIPRHPSSVSRTGPTGRRSPQTR